MKKLIALMLALVLVVGLVACGGTKASKASKDSKLIGVAMPTKDLQRWVQDGDNMKAKQLEQLATKSTCSTLQTTSPLRFLRFRT